MTRSLSTRDIDSTHREPSSLTSELYWRLSGGPPSFCPGPALEDRDGGLHGGHGVPFWPASLAVVASSCLVLRVRASPVRLSPWRLAAPSWASFAYFGTRFLSVALLSKGRVRFLFGVCVSGNGWSGTLFRARVSGNACMSDDPVVSDSRWVLKQKGDLGVSLYCYFVPYPHLSLC